MKETYPKALEFVLQAEGGYSDVPGDNGGATNKGITHIEYDAYRSAKGEEPRDVRDISDAEVQDIYRHNYWNRVSGDVLPYPLDIIAFDTAVNMGVGTSNLMLGQAEGGIGASVDLSALAAKTPGQVHVIAEAFLSLRETRYDRIAQIPHDAQFLRGWLNRLNALRHITGC